MWRTASTIAALAACRIHFDPITTQSDGARGDTTRLGDGTPDARPAPFVQAVSVEVAGGAPIPVDGTAGLAPVTPGNIVIVVCGGLNAGTACAPVSTPPATWQQIDPGLTLGVYVACNAPAIA